MIPRNRRLAVLALAAGLIGCGGSEDTPSVTTLPEPPPPEVEEEYRALLEGLDEELPGAAVASLRGFRDRNRGYEISAEADAEIERFTTLASGRYHLARELAREGEFDRARSVLEDLANHLADTADGEAAVEHLKGDFDVGQAQWLASRQRWEESENVARAALGRGLRGQQAEQLEQILDNAGIVSAARSTANRTQAMAACRQVMIVLEVTMAEEGEYPRRFSLADVEAYDAVGGRGIRRSIDAIEGYKRTAAGYDLVCVGADGRSRIRVVDGSLEP